MLRRGQGHTLYNDELQEKIQRECVPAAVARAGALPYNHPPFEAILFLPMTYLPYFSAFCLWVAVNILLLAGSVYSARLWLPSIVAHFRSLLVLAPLAFFPIADALLQGQDSILLLFLYCLTFAALHRSKELLAGVCLGLGLFKFHLVLPFALILLLHRRWRVLGGMAVIAVLEALVSWAIVGANQLFNYPRYAWQINRAQSPGVIVPANMANLRGLFTGWPEMNPPPLWVEAALVASSIVLIVWASRQWRPLERIPIDRWNGGFAVCLVASYLVGYHGYNQDMSFLLLALFAGVDQMLGAWQETSAGLKVVLGIMFLSPLYLFLTIRLEHQNLFAIVLLFLARFLAAAAKAKPGALVNRSTALSSAPLP
jgi:hypothetical protein